MRKFVILFLFCLFSIQMTLADAGAAASLKGKIVVVDPGHGGYDPGAVRGDIYEKDINLRIALELKKILEEKGSTVVLTRDGDYNLAIVGLHKREAKRYDLSKRLETADN